MNEISSTANETQTDITPVDWVTTLRQRGVTLELKGNRLVLRPASAYKDLSDAELLTLRHHREEIKTIVKSAIATTPGAPSRRDEPTAPAVHDLLRDGPVEVLGGGRVRPATNDRQATEEFVRALRRQRQGW